MTTAVIVSVIAVAALIGLGGCLLIYLSGAADQADAMDKTKW